MYHFYNFSVGFKEPQSKKLEIKMFMELVSVSLGEKKQLIITARNNFRDLPGKPFNSKMGKLKPRGTG